MPYPLPLTRTEAYLAYKAGVIQQSDLKPSLAVPRNGIDAWLAYWTGLAADYPKREDGTPHILQEEEAYIAYLCGVINEYPEKCLRRVGAYLRYLISARWGRPGHPLNREELYLSLLKTQVIPSGDPSSDIVIDGTAKAPFVDVKMYGDTFQQTYTGKNLVRPVGTSGVVATYNEATGEYSVSREAAATWPWLTGYCELPQTITSGTTITISRNVGSSFNFWVRTYHPDNTYGSHNFGTNTLSQVITEEKDIDRIVIMANSVPDNFSYSFKLQVEIGNQATSFEPYVGGVPAPNPDYPQPIQTVTGEQVVEILGKNLYAVKTGSYRGIDLTVHDDGTFDIKGTVSGGGCYFINYLPISYMKNGAKYSWWTNQSNLPNGLYFRLALSKGTTWVRNCATEMTGANTSRTFTANTTGDVDSIRCEIHLPNGTTVDLKNVQIQCEKSETRTEFEPYSLQTLPINLGKNLISANWESGRYNNSTGAKEPYSDNVRTDSPISVQPNTTYICSRNGSGVAMNILEYKADGSFIRATTISSGNSFTTGADTYYITMFRGISGGTDGIQLELGSNITPYAPYFTPIELCKLGDYQDYIYKDGSDWKVHKATKSVTLTGSENWQYRTAGTTADFYQISNANWNDYFGAGTNAIGTGPTDIQPISAFAADKLTSIDANDANMKANEGIGKKGQWLRISLLTSRGVTSVDDFKTWLASNNVKTYYALATPTDTIITNQALIDQLEALVAGGAENGTTYIKVNATDPNLPGLLVVEAPKYE